MTKAQRLIVLWVLLVSSVLPGLAQATRYGPPYDIGSGGRYSTLGEAIAALDAVLARRSPHCIYTHGTVPSVQRGFGVAAWFPVANASESDESGRLICIPWGAVYMHGDPDAFYILATGYEDNEGDPGRNLGAAGTCDGGEGRDEAIPAQCPAAKGAPIVGDGLNWATGNHYRQEDDYVANDWLTLRRFYNSHRAITSTAMGAHWRHSFDRSIEVADPILATVFRPDGTQETFKKVAGSWAAGGGIADVLTEHKDVQGAVTGYTLFVAAHRHVETYDAEGRLHRVTDATGEGITLAYETLILPEGGAPVSVLSTVTDPQGRHLQFHYTPDGTQLTGVTLPGGGTLHYSHDADGNLKAVTQPDGTTRQYAYTETALGGEPDRYPHLLTGLVDEAGERYESIRYFGRRAIATSFAGEVGTVRLDDYRGVVYPLGGDVWLNRANENGLARVRGLNRPCGPSCGQPWEYRSYDVNGNPKTATDFNGHVTATTYDANNLLTRQVEAQGESDERTTDTTWDAALRLPLRRSLRDAKGTLQAQTQWVYNAQGQTLARCEADPGTAGAAAYACSEQGAVPNGVRRWTATYGTVRGDHGPLARRLTTRGSRTDVTDLTRFSYYPATDESGCGIAGGTCHRAGDLSNVTDALGHVTTAVIYDKDGRLLRQHDAHGVITDRTYSARGRLLSRTLRARADGTPSPADAVTVLTYTPYGALASVTDPDGVTIRATYDAAHRLTDITDAQGNRIHYTLDAAGNATREETFDASRMLRRSLARTYNKLGQLTSIQDGLGRTVFDASFTDHFHPSYDTQGYLVRSADGLGVQRTQGYDALGRVIRRIDDDHGTDATTRNTESLFVYGARDELRGVSDPDGLDTTYDDDGLGNSLAIHSPDTGDSISTYDAAGNRLTTTDATGQTTRYTYDALNRLIATHYTDAMQDVAYHYDEANPLTGCAASYPIGRLTRIVEQAMTTTYCYDARGNVTQVRKIRADGTETLAYTYTLANRMRTETRPSGTVLTYTYDNVGHIAKVTVTSAEGVTRTVVSDIRYLPFGAVQAYVLGNGQTLSRTVDANYRITDLASPALDLHFSRDVMGNITAVTEGGTETANYRYDPLYRLTSVDDTDGKGIEAYTYNRTGDRLSKQGPGTLTGAYTYAPGTHHLIGVGTTTREVDAKGNTTASLLASGDYGFEYNARHRLTRLTKDGGEVGAYTLNAQGQRVAKVADGVTTRFTYDGASRLLAEASGATTRDYIWLGDLPVGVLDQGPNGAALTYVHADALGTPRAVTDEGGAVLWRWPYAANPFGEVGPVLAVGFVLNLRFPGQYFDAESGLNYNVNRDYEPATGRYIQSDPLGLLGGSTTFSYAAASPLELVDPLGLYCLKEWQIRGIAGAAVGGIVGGIAGSETGPGAALTATAGALVNGAAGVVDGLTSGEASGAYTASVGSMAGATSKADFVGGLPGAAIGGALASNLEGQGYSRPAANITGATVGASLGAVVSGYVRGVSVKGIMSGAAKGGAIGLGAAAVQAGLEAAIRAGNQCICGK